MNYLETCLNLELSIKELFRIAKEKIFLFVNRNEKNILQTYFINDEEEILEEVEKRAGYIFDSRVKKYNANFDLLCFENIVQKENFNNKCIAN
jgi:hypothetical protein